MKYFVHIDLFFLLNVSDYFEISRFIIKFNFPFVFLCRQFPAAGFFFFQP